MERLNQKNYDEILKVDLCQEKQELKELKEQLAWGPKDILEKIKNKIKELDPNIDITGDFTKEYTKCMGFKKLIITQLWSDMTIVYDDLFDKRHWIRYIDGKCYISDKENKRGMKLPDDKAKIRLAEIYSKIESMAKTNKFNRGGDQDEDPDPSVIDTTNIL